MTKPSGLRDPARAVRGLGAVALVVEAVVLLLALAPMIKLGGAHREVAVVLCVALAVVAVALAGLLRAAWAWWAAAIVPLALIGGGIAVNLSLFVLGVLFGLVWVYVLYVRRSIR
jgi:hypothetical protein